MKIIVATPSLAGPTDLYKNSLAASAQLFEAAGTQCSYTEIRGNPYISAARATMLRNALDAKADAVVFIDYDVAWRPADLPTLIAAPGDVVAGLYRFKKTDEEYMGGIESDATGRPILRDDGCMRASRVPAGFLKITKECVDRFMAAYPELVYGPRYNPSVDLFNHGAIGGLWYGEDYAFSKRWTDCGGEIWVVPDLGIDHHDAPSAEHPEGRVFAGNYHEFMTRQPGGSRDPARLAVAA